MRTWVQSPKTYIRAQLWQRKYPRSGKFVVRRKAGLWTFPASQLLSWWNSRFRETSHPKPKEENTKRRAVVNPGLHKCTHKYICLHSNTNTFVHPHSYPLCAQKRAKGGSNLPLIAWHRQTSLHKISGKRKTCSVFNGTCSKRFLHGFVPSGNELASASGKHMAKIRSSMASDHGQVLSCDPMRQPTHSSKWQFNFPMKPSRF